MLGKGYVHEPRKIIQEISGFYPLFEVLLDRYGDPITPAVFGVAWRFCQMEDGVCKASLRTIAAILNVSEATVMRRLEILCGDGYLIDLTPDLKNRPHVYSDSGQVVMKSALGASSKTVSQRKVTVSGRKATVSQSQLNKDLNKDSNKEGGEPGPAKPKANDLPEVVLFREVTGFYPAKASFETVVSAVGQVRGRLGRDVSAEDLRPFYVAWCNRGWNKQAVTWLTDYAAANRLPNGSSFKQPDLSPAQPQLSPDELERKRAEITAQFRAEGRIP
jgi:DNA-binding Lrp family transcriptional regulator